MDISIRNFPTDLWKRARALGIEKGLTVKGVLIEALRDWIRKPEAK